MDTPTPQAHEAGPVLGDGEQVLDKRQKTEIDVRSLGIGVNLAVLAVIVYRSVEDTVVGGNGGAALALGALGFLFSSVVRWSIFATNCRVIVVRTLPLVPWYHAFEDCHFSFVERTVFRRGFVAVRTLAIGISCMVLGLLTFHRRGEWEPLMSSVDFYWMVEGSLLFMLARVVLRGARRGRIPWVRLAVLAFFIWLVHSKLNEIAPKGVALARSMGVVVFSILPAALLGFGGLAVLLALYSGFRFAVSLDLVSGERFPHVSFGMGHLPIDEEFAKSLIAAARKHQEEAR